MARQYFTRRDKPVVNSDWWDEPNLTSLAKTVYEVDETIDIGLLDAAGNKILARERKDQIGFVRFVDK